METIGEGPRRRGRRGRKGVAAAIALALGATAGVVLAVRPEDDPGIKVETAKPSFEEVAPAGRGIEAPGTASTTAEPSTTTTISVPTSHAPTSTTTTARRPRPSTTSSTVTTSTAPTATTAPPTDEPVALDRAGLYVARLDGSGLRRLSADVGVHPFHPAISPDGRRLAYVGAGEDVYVMDLANRTSRRLGGPVATFRSGGTPVWSPDSTRVAFAGNGETGPSGRDIWIADANGVEPIKVIRHPGDDGVVDWGPDGRLASTSEDGIAVYQPDGSSRTIIYDKGMGDPGFVRWSPDGTRVAAIPGGAGVSVVARADGGGSTELHHYDSGHGITGDFAATQVDWAPTSDRLILTGSTPDPERAPRLRLVKLDNTPLWAQPIGSGWSTSLDWAPTGEVIATLLQGRIELYDATTGARTGTFMPLPAGLRATGYSWTPDGTAIAFIVAAG